MRETDTHTRQEAMAKLQIDTKVVFLASMGGGEARLPSSLEHHGILERIFMHLKCRRLLWVAT